MGQENMLSLCLSLQLKYSQVSFKCYYGLNFTPDSPFINRLNIWDSIWGQNVLKVVRANQGHKSGDLHNVLEPL